MKSSLMLRVILASVLLCTVFADLSKDAKANAAAKCVANGATYVCGDCANTYKCDDDTVVECTDKVCEEKSSDGTAECKAIAAITKGNPAENCNCLGQANGVLCDPYDPRGYSYCMRGEKLASTQCLANQVCENNACIIAPTPAPTSAPGVCADAAADGTFVAVTPACTSYAYCSDSDVLFEQPCLTAGTFFDALANKCVSVLPCKGACGDGKCPNMNDCSKYDYCKGGELEGSSTCDDDNKLFFNPRAGGSCGDVEDKCHPMTQGCKFPGESTTTPPTDGTTKGTTAGTTKGTTEGTTLATTGGTTKATTDGTTLATTGGTTKGTTKGTTAAVTKPTEAPVTKPPQSACNEQTAYLLWEDPEDCKKYYQCTPTPAGTYVMVNSPCYGSLVFNPKKRKCDLAANVPGCP